MQTQRGVVTNYNPDKFGFIRLDDTDVILWFGSLVGLHPDTQPRDLRVGMHVTFEVARRGYRVSAVNVRLTNPDDCGWPPRNVAPLAEENIQCRP